MGSTTSEATYALSESHKDVRRFHSLAFFSHANRSATAPGEVLGRDRSRDRRDHGELPHFCIASHSSKPICRGRKLTDNDHQSSSSPPRTSHHVLSSMPSARPCPTSTQRDTQERDTMEAISILMPSSLPARLVRSRRSTLTRRSGASMCSACQEALRTCKYTRLLCDHMKD